MRTWPSTLVVSIPEAGSSGSVTIDVPPLAVVVGDEISAECAEDLGLAEKSLSERALGFVVLVLLDQFNQLDTTTDRARAPQRSRFAEHLGMTLFGFRKFINRTLRREPGRILRWDRKNLCGREPSWTGGPWWLAVRDARVEPSLAAARAFLERLRITAIDRRGGPSLLLRSALAEREAGNWIEAEVLLKFAAEMYKRREWPRDQPLWFDILLLLAGTKMQIGREGLWPRLPVNIRISVTEQRLREPDANLIRARAHLSRR